MRYQKPVKIDLSSEYPCPCRRRGRLIPIILTEAFGCDRCQQIFVLEENGQVIEQLSATYPYKRAWRWTGYRWIVARHGLAEGYLPLMSAIILFLLIVWLILALRSPVSLGMMSWIVMAILLLIIPVMLFWFTYRR